MGIFSHPQVILKSPYDFIRFYRFLKLDVLIYLFIIIFPSKQFLGPPQQARGQKKFIPTYIRIRLYIKNETSLKKRNLERNRPKKTQPRRRQVSEKKKRNLPEGQVSEKKNATWPTARLRFF